MNARARGLAVAGVCAAGVWLLWRAFVATSAGQRVERLALDGAAHGLLPGAGRVLGVISVGFIVVASAAAVVVALARRRWHLALQAVVLVAGANLTTQLLKHTVLDRPRLGDAPPRTNSLPSGHTTAAASVSLALLLVVPVRWRPATAVAGAAWTALTGASTQVGGWHRPSDVVAALLVALAWFAVVGALLGRPLAAVRVTSFPAGPAAGPSKGLPKAPSDGRGPGRAGERALVVGGVACGLAALAALAVTWANREPPAPVAIELLAHLGGLLAAACAAAFTFAQALALRRGLDEPS